ncbi:MAG: hypothetical protein HY537_10280 [Deltaproteobacteria bacterium]|nr:hypothetical protein [Deltaproteobacteria bacterium]
MSRSFSSFILLISVLLPLTEAPATIDSIIVHHATRPEAQTSTATAAAQPMFNCTTGPPKDYTVPTNGVLSHELRAEIADILIHCDSSSIRQQFLFSKLKKAHPQLADAIDGLATGAQAPAEVLGHLTPSDKTVKLLTLLHVLFLNDKELRAWIGTQFKTTVEGGSKTPIPKKLAERLAKGALHELGNAISEKAGEKISSLLPSLSSDDLLLARLLTDEPLTRSGALETILGPLHATHLRALLRGLRFQDKRPLSQQNVLADLPLKEVPAVNRLYHFLMELQHDPEGKNFVDEIHSIAKQLEKLNLNQREQLRFALISRLVEIKDGKYDDDPEPLKRTRTVVLAQGLASAIWHLDHANTEGLYTEAKTSSSYVPFEYFGNLQKEHRLLSELRGKVDPAKSNQVARTITDLDDFVYYASFQRFPNHPSSSTEEPYHAGVPTEARTLLLTQTEMDRRTLRYFAEASNDSLHRFRAVDFIRNPSVSKLLNTTLRLEHRKAVKKGLLESIANDIFEDKEIIERTGMRFQALKDVSKLTRNHSSDWEKIERIREQAIQMILRLQARKPKDHKDSLALHALALTIRVLDQLGNRPSEISELLTNDPQGSGYEQLPEGTHRDLAEILDELALRKRAMDFPDLQPHQTQLERWRVYLASRGRALPTLSRIAFLRPGLEDGRLKIGEPSGLSPVHFEMLNQLEPVMNTDAEAREEFFKLLRSPLPHAIEQAFKKYKTREYEGLLSKGAWYPQTLLTEDPQTSLQDSISNAHVLEGRQRHVENEMTAVFTRLGNGELSQKEAGKTISILNNGLQHEMLHAQAFSHPLSQEVEHTVSALLKARGKAENSSLSPEENVQILLDLLRKRDKQINTLADVGFVHLPWLPQETTADPSVFLDSLRKKIPQAVDLAIAREALWQKEQERKESVKREADQTQQAIARLAAVRHLSSGGDEGGTRQILSLVFPNKQREIEFQQAKKVSVITGELEPLAKSFSAAHQSWDDHLNRDFQQALASYHAQINEGNLSIARAMKEAQMAANNALNNAGTDKEAIRQAILSARHLLSFATQTIMEQREEMVAKLIREHKNLRDTAHKQRAKLFVSKNPVEKIAERAGLDLSKSQDRELLDRVVYHSLEKYNTAKTAPSSETEAARKTLLSLGLRVVGTQVSFNDTELYQWADPQTGAIDKNIIHQLRTAGHILTGKDLWEQLLNEIRHAHIESELKPVFQFGKATAVQYSLKGEQENIAFWPLSRKRTELAHIKRELEQLHFENRKKIEAAGSFWYTAGNILYNWFPVGLGFDYSEKKVDLEVRNSDQAFNQKINELQEKGGALEISPLKQDNQSPRTASEWAQLFRDRRLDNLHYENWIYGKKVPQNITLARDATVELLITAPELVLSGGLATPAKAGRIARLFYGSMTITRAALWTKRVSSWSAHAAKGAATLTLASGIIPVAGELFHKGEKWTAWQQFQTQDDDHNGIPDWWDRYRAGQEIGIPGTILSNHGNKPFWERVDLENPLREWDHTFKILFLTRFFLGGISSTASKLSGKAPSNGLLKGIINTGNQLETVLGVKHMAALFLATWTKLHFDNEGLKAERLSQHSWGNIQSEDPKEEWVLAYYALKTSVAANALDTHLAGKLSNAISKYATAYGVNALASAAMPQLDHLVESVTGKKVRRDNMGSLENWISNIPTDLLLSIGAINSKLDPYRSGTNGPVTPQPQSPASRRRVR